MEDRPISASVLPPPAPPRCPSVDEARAAYVQVRAFTDRLCQTLEPEDCVVQSMTDASPVRWHLAHTTWFFETFLLEPLAGIGALSPPEYQRLFNSYYNSVGQPFPREHRGRLSRPTLAQVRRYRQAVDQALLGWLDQVDDAAWQQASPILQLGLQHEQQHQELILTDIKHAFSINPLRPAFLPDGMVPSRDGDVRSRDGGVQPRDGDVCPPDVDGGSEGRDVGPEQRRDAADARRRPLEWIAYDEWIGYDEQVTLIGHDGQGFAYDNETPQHRVLVPSFQLAESLVTNAQFLEFIADRGYQQPAHWLSAGWEAARAGDWQAPLYWVRDGDQWYEFTLAGLRPLCGEQPVAHVSYFEADAYARWAGCRLPTEFQWELAARPLRIEGTFADAGCFHPRPAPADAAQRPRQMFGDLWQWTASPYTGYPGYQPPRGAIGEYNGKFMCNQFVLRGGSVATSRSHIRCTYRNFFPPEARWQFSGIRLARDVP